MPHFDTGNTGFMLMCSALVLLMTPGLAFFYGGFVGRKNVLTIVSQSFVSMGWTTVIWFLYGYSLCFSGDWHGIIGDFHYAMLRNITANTPSPANPSIPLTVHIAYQLMFAIITPALITGAFAHRVKFKAYLLFLTAWLTLVYFPFVHMLWTPNGLLAHWGVLDFAGGIVVHNIAGFAALASVLYIGKRKVIDHGMHDVPMIALGTGLLWFGWFGFNAGSEFGVDSVTSIAFINSQIAAAFGAMTWLLIARVTNHKPSLVGFLVGAVAGLATITPAAGFVSPTAAVFIGISAGVVCYYAVALKNKLQWDDALDVWGVHGLGGLLGIVLLGVFADKNFNPAGADGLLLGNSGFLVKQVVAIIFSSLWAFVFTLGMFKVIDWITPVRVSEAEERIGLDTSLLGEQAYD